MVQPATLQVLLIEDNPADSDLIAEALEDAQLGLVPGAAAFALTHVDSLAAGLARLVASEVAVVLLDLSLPDSHGFETFVRLATQAPATPIVVLSGLDDEGLAVHAVREGAQDYLVKGQVDGATLVRALRYAIERKHAEEERARLVSEQAAAEAALRARNEMLAAVVHDLRTPLTTIHGVTQLLTRRVAGGQLPAPDELERQLAQIARSTTRMTRLIDDLVDVAQLQAGHPLDLRRAPTDLVALARQAVAETQRTAERHTIRFASPEPAVVGTWDAARLERVVANLLGNAVKYSPGGGDVAVTVTREGTPPDAWAVLRVRDEGLGIPAEDLPRVFERFYRGTNVAGQIQGSGIGLAGARQIVEQHGGSIAVESQEGVGSTFTVRLPLDAP
ncbi:MAG TPA: hybrid sensor histidine kinase/response regulator [Chloroflexota bacterium]|nr:hybrid sensor histidine kinase/response regulator [Chloroflexota bacterium]